jgi:hypothetical protein
VYLLTSFTPLDFIVRIKRAAALMVIVLNKQIKSTVDKEIVVVVGSPGYN